MFFWRLARCEVWAPVVLLKLSVKSDYAARAVLGLARHYPTGQAVRVEDLAAEQNVPPNYLVQILIELKAQGIARSQPAAVSQQLAGMRIEIAYHRPVARGRPLFGALVPWGRIWSPSADSVARLTISGPVER